MCEQETLQTEFRRETRLLFLRREETCFLPPTPSSLFFLTASPQSENYAHAGYSKLELPMKLQQTSFVMERISREHNLLPEAVGAS